MTTLKPKKYTYFIGIDVSRNELDYAVLKGTTFLFHREAKNEVDDINAFIAELKTLPNFTISKAMFCMEHTGLYCNHLLKCLKKIKANAVLENALKIKNSHGLLRGKYDKADAIRIAQYASKYKGDLYLWNHRRQVIQELTNIYILRGKLMNNINAIRMPLKEQASFVSKKLNKQSFDFCKMTLKGMTHDIDKIDKAIDLLIASDDYINSLVKLIISVPYVGRITAIQVIISTNEFRDINGPKQFACYAGVVPFKHESGITKGRSKVSQISNRKVKALLHLCAVGSIRHEGEFKTYYQRKLKEGKSKMSVINAIRNKLVLRIFSCVNQNRLYEKDYVRPIHNEIAN